MRGIDGECIDRAQRRSSEMCVKFIWPAEYQVALVSTADKKRVCSQRDATADGFNALTKGHLCLFFFIKPIYCLPQRKA